MNPKHFLTLLDLSAAELQRLVRRAIELKAFNRAGTIHEPFKHKVLAMVFEKSSTRTRMSFEVGMA
jgi:ornithine carbamoyltransferase